MENIPIFHDSHGWHLLCASCWTRIEQKLLCNQSYYGGLTFHKIFWNNFHDEFFNAVEDKKKAYTKPTPTIQINLKKTPMEYNKTLLQIYTRFIKG
jgi:hypothetical protein